MNIEGTNAADTLQGTGDADLMNGGQGDDVLHGLGGDDRIDGGSGADRMAGGSGDDLYIVDDDSTVLERDSAGAAILKGDQVSEAAGEGIDEVRSLVWLYTLPAHVENLTGTDVRGQGLYGNALDNVITGFTGWDGISDTAGGDDKLFGGEGDDGISVSRYDHHSASTLLLDGGLGDDVLTYSGSRYVDSVTLLGGEGNDHLSIFRGGAVTIDAGAGADRIGLNFLGAQVAITLGGGMDWLIIQRELGFGIDGGSITVTDFQTGDLGDRLVIDLYLASVLQGWDPATNVFGAGFADLVQEGADVLFRIDKDGAAGPGGFTALVRFEDRQVADFTQFNLGGYALDGGAAGVTTVGTAGNDVLTGTYGDDVLIGLDGHDELVGGAGDDRLEGGNGLNRLDGQLGTDQLFGGDDHDILSDDQDGDDRLFGGGGWDDILVSRKGEAPASTVLLDGGDGGDRMFFSATGRGIDTATLLGGEGNDDIVITGRGNITVDGGAGDDHVDINFSSGLYTVALGAGYDQLYLGKFADRDAGGPDLFDTRILVTDFAAGEMGPGIDVLFFRDYLKSVLPGWDGVGDPFGAGYLNMSQEGADAVIRLDPDGPGEDPGRELVRLAGVDAGTLTAYNLNGLESPAIKGSDLDETITAGAGDHVLEGLGGNDRLTGGSGNDRLDGGGGADVLRLHHGGDDTVLAGAGNDNIFFVGSLTGADVVNGGEGTDTLVLQGPYGALALTANVTLIENISILGGNNVMFGEPGTNRHDYSLTTADSNFAAGVQARINGAALQVGEDFTFDGSAESDAHFVVYGGRGKDTLTGGLGNDIFFYAEERFESGDVVNGGAGYNGMFLRGNYTIDFNAPGFTGLFTNIQNLTLTSATDERYARGGGTEFDYNLTLSDAIVKAGHTLTVSGSLLLATETMILDASQEADGILRLFGGKAGDTLKGGGLADLIHGNLGADVLAGNGGADAFRYQDVAESNLASMDQILDFTPGTDKIELDRIDADSLAAGNQAFSWIGSNAFSGSAGQLRAYEQNGTWFVEGDTDGDSVADLVIALTLQGATPLGAGDFLL